MNVSDQSSRSGDVARDLEAARDAARLASRLRVDFWRLFPGHEQARTLGQLFHSIGRDSTPEGGTVDADALGTLCATPNFDRKGIVVAFFRANDYLQTSPGYYYYRSVSEAIEVEARFFVHDFHQAIFGSYETEEDALRSLVLAGPKLVALLDESMMQSTPKAHCEALAKILEEYGTRTFQTLSPLEEYIREGDVGTYRRPFDEDSFERDFGKPLELFDIDVDTELRAVLPYLPPTGFGAG